MKFAFCLFKYFPYGGLQRGFLRIAAEAMRRGHDVKAFTMEWQGDIPVGMRVTVVKAPGLSNRRRNINFHRNMMTQLRAEGYDALVGFNKLPDLDVYYAADVCFKDRTAQHSALYKMTPRYRHFIACEEAIFAPAARTQIMLLAEGQKAPYMRQYGTPDERFHVLPPDIAPDRIAEDRDPARRAAARAGLGIAPDELIVLMVGSGFKTKGLDRALEALAALPAALSGRARLWIAGEDNARPFKRRAAALGIADRVDFLGGRDDIPALMLAADVLIHPAYHENTGNALLEAMAYGLPVLATDVCGYAPHVARAQAGLLADSPFSQAELNEMLARLLQTDDRDALGARGIAYIKAMDVRARVRQAVDIVENAAR